MPEYWGCGCLRLSADNAVSGMSQRCHRQSTSICRTLRQCLSLWCNMTTKSACMRRSTLLRRSLRGIPGAFVL